MRNNIFLILLKIRHRCNYLKKKYKKNEESQKCVSGPEKSVSILIQYKQHLKQSS